MVMPSFRLLQQRGVEAGGGWVHADLLASMSALPRTAPHAAAPGPALQRCAHLSACSRICIAASAALRLLTSRCTATQLATRPLPG